MQQTGDYLSDASGKTDPITWKHSMNDEGTSLRADGAEDDPLSVDASPTKAFFCNVITRDLNLEQAIADLIDNCVDGAKRLRGSASATGDTKKYAGLWIKLQFNSTEFILEDNCGGIDLEIARKYAFKFGRDEKFTGSPGSVGQFGVGMKRALFKMGSEFKVETRSVTHSYSINVNVPEWLGKKFWDFKVSDLSEAETPVEETGTKITVTNLYSGTSALFNANYFRMRVESELKTSQQHFIRSGLSISVNGLSIVSPEWQLKSGDSIKPFYQRYEDAGGKSNLITRVYCGVGPSSSNHAGWYVFCNGRCIVSADQSITTGWGEQPGTESISIPKYHPQFSKFRGYAFLDSDDAERLPWNTTKTDLDLDHQEYMRLRRRLIEVTRPIINFLNELDRESEILPEDQEMTRHLDRAPLVSLANITTPQSFSYNRTVVKKGPVLRNIAYKKPETEIVQLQGALGTTNARDTGIKAFEYCYSRLVAEDDL